MDDSISLSTWGYGEEHSLEVELPFIQRVLPGVPIVPIVVGYQSLELGFHLSRTLGAILAAIDPAATSCSPRTGVVHSPSISNCSCVIPSVKEL